MIVRASSPPYGESVQIDLISVVAPGWVELALSGHEPRPRVLARIEKREGRGVVTALVLLGESLDSATLRAIPVGRIESAINHPQFGWGGGLRIDAAALREFADRGVLFPDEFGQIDAALTTYVEKAPDSGHGGKVTRRKSARKPLRRPDGSDPEGFYRTVADAYNDAVLTTAAPAPVLAEEAGVPVGTVHRWIREARRGGYLPPAKKGRAG